MKQSNMQILVPVVNSIHDFPTEISCKEKLHFLTASILFGVFANAKLLSY